MLALLHDLLLDDKTLEPALVVADRNHTTGIAEAQKLGVKTKIVDYHSGSNKEHCEKKLFEELSLAKVDIICLAGFMQILTPTFIKEFGNKILNIHPSILPLFKGLNTHKRALESGMIIHGATVHLVTAEIDSGKILGQAIVPILTDDTESTLAQRVLKIEHTLYPMVLKRFVNSENQPLLITRMSSFSALD